MTKNIETALRKALSYLASQQEADGSFVSFSSPRIVPFQPTYTYHTTFTPALVLGALSRIELPGASGIRTKLADFLFRQKSEHWSFNYWVRGSREAQETPYPDDLDDTFCVLSALYLHDASLIDESVLAHTVKLLLATESQVGGPYRTWLVNTDAPKKWQDVDLAVNANIAYFLSLTSNPLPRLTDMMARAIKKRAFSSPYYPDAYPVVYYLARAYPGSSQALAHYLMDQRQSDGSWGTPLHTALAVSSLLKMNEFDTTESIQYLLKMQAADGSWPAKAFCLDPAKDDTQYYSGSPALTTAFAIEALCLFQEPISSSEKRHKSNSVHQLQKQIISQATKDLKLLDTDLRETSLTMLRHITQSKNNQEIILLPYFFYTSLKIQPKVSRQLFVDLGLANLYGWMAYTIYDDFLDDEGDPRLLSAANVALRRSVATFSGALPEDVAFQKHAQKVFDTIDAANTWEIAHCRFKVTKHTINVDTLPTYGKLDRLAERSLGHTLTPMGILAAIGKSPTSPEAHSLESALRHYLIARQLNDDIHDWKQDFKAGRITYVVAQILKEIPKIREVQKIATIQPHMERQFWHYTLEQICQRIIRHTELSRQDLKQTGLLKTDGPMEKLLNKIDISVQETRHTVAGVEKFLASYRSKNNG